MKILKKVFSNIERSKFLNKFGTKKKMLSKDRKKVPSKPIMPEQNKKLEKPATKKLKIAQLKVLNNKKKKLKAKEKKDIDGVEYLSEEDIALDIPAIPEAPKKRVKITLESPDLSTDVTDKIKKMESRDIEIILVNCERCKEIIFIPIPKKAVLRSKLPIVPISYVHKNKQNKDQHCITIHIDHNFDIRRQRISDVILS